MFTAYIDDSGTDPAQPIANATALIIPAKRIVALQNEWDKLRKNQGFDKFHTSEFVFRNPKSEFAQWDDPKRELVFRRVREICKKYGTHVISITVNKMDYDEVVPDHLRKHTGPHHYTWAVRSLLPHIHRWHLVVSNADCPMQFVFDSMGEQKKNLSRREIENLMEQAEESFASKGFPGEFSNWSFQNSKLIPGLQCVDLLAWSVYQYGLFAFQKKPLHPYAQIAWDDFSKYRDGKWGYVVTIAREHLAKWAELEIADGRSIEKICGRKRKRQTMNKGSDVASQEFKRFVDLMGKLLKIPPSAIKANPDAEKAAKRIATRKPKVR